MCDEKGERKEGSHQGGAKEVRRPWQGPEDKFWEAEEESGYCGGGTGWNRLRGTCTEEAGPEGCSMTQAWGFPFPQMKLRREKLERATLVKNGFRRMWVGTERRLAAWSP